MSASIVSESKTEDNQIDAAALWQQVSDKLRGQMLNATFKQHIKLLRAVEIEDGIMTLSCPPMSLDWLRFRLKAKVLEAVQSVQPDVKDVAFVVTGTKPLPEPKLNGTANKPPPPEASLKRGAENKGREASIVEKRREAAATQELPTVFKGFSPPRENWSKLPHEFIDAMPLVETGGEMKVILYILRHTWGYQNDERKITLDEFEHGRKRRDGTRIDRGTGLTRTTIVNGIRRAVKHGFIVVEVDTRDKARTKKYYALRGV